MSIHKNGQPWGYTATYRTGRSVLVGPYRSYQAAIHAMPNGPLILQAGAVPLPGVTGRVRVLRERHIDLTPPVAEVAPPEAQSITMDGGDLITIYDPEADFTGADLVVSFGKSPYEHYLPDFTVVDANTITLQWYPGGSPSSDYNTFIFGFEVFDGSDGPGWPGTTLGLYDLSADPIDATGADYAAINNVSSPADNQVQIDGVRFLTALYDIDRVTIAGRVYTNPAGPNSGDLSVGATILSWTDTQIVFEDATLNGVELGIVDFADYQGSNVALSTARANLNTHWHYMIYPAVPVT